jgi:hypothetical protein
MELPPPSLAASGVWPRETWGRNLLCLSCDHVFPYSGRDVYWLEMEVPPQAVPPEDPVIGCLQIRCAHEGCIFPVLVHISLASWPPTEELLLSVPHWKFREVRCRDGHGPHPYRTQAEARFVDRNWWM